MTVIQIRDVPEEIHRELTRQAQTAGLSLNRYLLQEIRQLALRGRNAEVLQRARSRRGPRLTREQIVETMREVRGE